MKRSPDPGLAVKRESGVIPHQDRPNGQARPRTAILRAVSRTHKLIAAAVFGAAFAIASVIRGDVAPGLVGGVLGGVLLYLLLTRVQEHNDAVRRRREREPREP